VAPDGRRLARLGELLGAGTIGVTVSAPFPLEQAVRVLAASPVSPRQETGLPTAWSPKVVILRPSMVHGSAFWACNLVASTAAWAAPVRAVWVMMASRYGAPGPLGRSPGTHTPAVR
jgi:hypothetical protein